TRSKLRMHRPEKFKLLFNETRDLRFPISGKPAMMGRNHTCALLALSALAGIMGLRAALASAPQTPAPRKPTSGTDSSVILQVMGDVSRPLGFTAEELANLPRQEIRAIRHDGVESRFAGAPLIEILAKAGVPSGKDLRGPAMALYLVVEASDGYRAVFS